MGTNTVHDNVTTAQESSEPHVIPEYVFDHGTYTFFHPPCCSPFARWRLTQFDCACRYKRHLLSELTNNCPAPIFHLYTTDRYRPSSFKAFLDHTRPQIDFKDTAIPLPPLTLANLDQLNNLAAERDGGIYLTSFDDVTKSPEWLDGVKIDSDNGTGNERTGVVIIVDKGKGIVDVFYFVLWAFNWGGIVLEKQLGSFSQSISTRIFWVHEEDWQYTDPRQATMLATGSTP